MLKGVNRQVVEVSETGSEYFERALFFVSPKYYGMGEGKLRERAQFLVNSASAPPKSKKAQKKSKLKKAIEIAASAAAGAAVALLTVGVF